MSEWISTKLGNILTLKRGYDLPNKSRKRGSIPVVSSSGVSDFHAEYKVKAPGVVTGRYGTIGEVFYIAEDFWPLNTTLYVEDFKGNDPLFISYFLQCIDFQAYAAKSAVPGINRNDLHLADVHIPDVFTQKQLAYILFSYDNLITNNNRRITILEEMAQKLYREWFVHFRFPGHENVKMVESEMGLIPEGWEIKKAYEVLTTQYGYTETAQNAAVGPQYLRGTDINKKSYIDWSSVPYCPINSEKKKKYSLEIGDVVIIRMADPGKIGIVEEDVDAVFASYLIKLKPIKNYLTPYYLFYMTSDKAFQGFVLGASTGATRKSISAETIKEAPVLKPSYSVLMEFEERVGVFRKGLVNLLQKNANLRKTRDLLLPRLISGDIDVSDLNIPIKEG